MSGDGRFSSLHSELIKPTDVLSIKEKLEELNKLNEDKLDEEFESAVSLPQTSVTIRNRPNLVWNFPEAPLPILNMQQHPANLAAIPEKSQEKIIVRELIHCLIGNSGQYIVVMRKGSATDFKISHQISESIRTVVGQILPLAKHFCVVQHFIQHCSSRESGQTLRAISAAMTDFLNEYYMSISALESDELKNRLTLQKLLFLIQPKMNGMLVLADVSKKILEHDVNGGKALSLLHKTILTLAGDSGMYNMHS